MAGPTGLGRFPWPGSLGAGPGRGTLALSQLSSHVRTDLRTGSARGHRVHFPARLGIHVTGNRRIPATFEWRPLRSTGSRNAHDPTDGTIRPHRGPRLALV